MRPRVGLGMLAAALVVTGHFAFFTYIRPFLETVTGVGVTGVANFVGNYLGGWMVERSLRLTMIAMPLLMGTPGVALVLLAALMILMGVRTRPLATA